MAPVHDQMVYDWTPPAALGAGPANRSRLAMLFDGIEIGVNRGIEMGPLDRPVMRKPRHRVLYIDRASREELQKKYRDAATAGTLTPENIEHVDIVWDGTKPLAEVTAQRAFDFCVSSRVIQHVPDVIGWLIQIGTLLRHGSLVNMSILHRDFTFDHRRGLTKPADLIQAYLEHRTRPNGAQVFDHVANAAMIGSNEPLARSALIMEAFKHAWGVTHADHYMDVHCSVFTPQSFLECFEVLSYTGLINLKLRKVWPQTACGDEFVVSMEFGGYPLEEMAASFRQGQLEAASDPGQS
ncbi:SAM-dependent methyltransferase [Nitrobacteraceae bacterium AZCC 2161]